MRECISIELHLRAMRASLSAEHIYDVFIHIRVCAISWIVFGVFNAPWSRAFMEAIKQMSDKMYLCM